MPRKNSAKRLLSLRGLTWPALARPVQVIIKIDDTILQLDGLPAAKVFL
jgi:hypothetical protein